MRKQGEGNTSPFMASNMAPFAGLDMFSFNGKLMECYMRAGQSLFMNAVKLNQEMLRFASERFRADVRAMQALSRCKDWSEIAGCQSEFAQSAAEAYQSEASKLTKLGTEATAATLKPLEEATKALSKS